MIEHVLQASQFFRERLAKAEEYRKHHHNGHADSDKPEDDEDAPTVRENPAHQNVFGR